MPAYPCVKCEHQVDLRDLTCRSCGEKKPFKCTKCDKRMSCYDIFQAEEITIKKPLFCKDCGRDQEAVKCSHCRTTLQRRDAVEMTSPRTHEELVFHPECHKTYELQMKVSQGIKYCLTPFAAWMGFSFMSAKFPMLGLLGLLLGIIFSLGLSFWMDPKK